MHALLFLRWRSFVNKLKQWREKPIQVLPVILTLVWFAFLFLSPQEVSAGGLRLPENQVLIAAIYGGLAFITSWANAYQAVKSGGGQFTPADSQFLFCGPFRAPTVLLYGISREAQSLLISTVFLIFQYRTFGRAGLSLGLYGWVMAIWILNSLNSSISGTLIYALAHRSETRSRRSAWLILISFLLYALLFAYLLYQNQQEGWAQIGLRLLRHPLTRLYPVCGWTLSIVFGLIDGWNVWASCSLALTLLLPPVLLYVIYHLPLDFYEDKLSSIELGDQSTVEAKQALREELIRKSVLKKKLGQTGLFGRGAGSLLGLYWRQMRRSQPYFLSFTSFLPHLLAAFLIIGEKQKGLPALAICLLGISGLQLFFSLPNSALGGHAAQAATFLLPFEPNALIFYAELPGWIRSALSRASLLTLFVLFNGLSPGNALRLFCFLLTFRLVLDAANLLFLALYGRSDGSLSFFLSLLLRFLATIPLAAILLLSSQTGREIFAVPACLLYGNIAGLVAFASGRAVLRRGPELK